MKKVLSLVLTLSLVLGTFSMAFAASNTSFSDVKGENCEEAVAVLTDLGVVTGYEDGTYKPENIVTRAEMAVLVVNALGLEDYVTASATSSFTDMDGYGWAQGYIAYAQSLGVISGYGDGTFKPGKTVSYDEAATMLVAALGYTPDSLQGTWPANYVTKAKSLGILDDIKAGSEGANRGDIAIMIYQTLDCGIGTVNKDGEFIPNQKKDGNGAITWFDCMLDRLGAKLYESNVTDKDGYFVVTGDEDSVINLAPYKGAYVNAYMNSDEEIIAIKEVKSTFVSGTINKDTLKAADGTEYTLKADALKDIGVGTTASAIKFENGDDGKAYAVSVDNTVNYTLAVDISGKKINEVYSVSYWKITKESVLEKDDVNDITANEKLLGVDFPLDDNDDIDVEAFELIGVDSLDDIKADMLAYVYQNDDKEIARIAIGTETVTGEVTKTASNGEKITVNGTTYKLASVELKGNGISTDAIPVNKIEAGDEVKLTIDAYGYIYDSELVSGNADKYAVVLKIGSTSGVDSTYQLKLFTAAGETVVFSVDDEGVKNGLFDSAKGEWATSAGAILATGSIIKYGLDKDNMIDVIDAKGLSGDNALKVIDYTTTEASISAKGYFQGLSIASDAVIFTTSETTPSNDGGDYAVTSRDKVLDTDVKAKYVVDDNEIVAMLIVDSASNDDVYGVATDWGTNNSDAGAYITLLIDGKEVTYNGDDGSKVLGRVSGKTNANDLGLFKVVFDTNGDIKDLQLSNTSAPADDFYVTTVAIGTATKAALSGKTFTYDAVSYTLDSPSVYVWDKDDKEYTIGSTSDLRALSDRWDVVLYDAVDDDGVYDIVIIIQK